MALPAKANISNPTWKAGKDGLAAQAGDGTGGVVISLKMLLEM